MTAISHPLVRTHALVTVLITAAVAVGLTVALIFAFSSSGDSSPATHAAPARTSAVIGSGAVGTVNSGPDNPSRSTSRLCRQIADATGSRPFDRLDDSITTGSC
jgi:hypothetical protein